MNQPLLKKMYDRSFDISDEWMKKIFPTENQGCINFGYWKNIRSPLTIQKRIKSQKNLYTEVFKKLSSDCEKMLEVGCGRGHGVFWLSERGYKSYGIDILESQISKAKENYPHLSSYLRVGSAEKMPFDDEFFDAIYSVEAAQHFKSFNSFCKESFRMLKPNRKLIIATYFFTNDKFIENVKTIIPSTIEGYHHAISISKAMHSLQKNNFRIKDFLSIGDVVFPFYAVWHKMQLQDTSVSYLNKERMRWSDYYTGGGKEGPPWYRAFKNGWIDYYIIEAIKVPYAEP